MVCLVPQRETIEASKTQAVDARLVSAAGQLRVSASAARERARAIGQPVLAWTSVPIPTADLVAFFGHGVHAATRMLFLRPDDRFGIAGLGDAWTYVCDGPDRFARAGEAWRMLAGHAVGDTGVDGPVALYGFAFEDAGGAWDGYPAGLLVVPRVAVHVEGDAVRLILSAIVDPDGRAAEDADATIACLGACGGLAGRPARDGAAGGAAGRVIATEPARPLRIIDEFPAEGVWKRSVADTATAVRAGRLRKAVLARGIRVEGGRLDAEAALSTLQREYPGCTTFAASRGARCFLGASPERLVRVRDGEVLVAALAGSAPRGETEALDRELGAGLLRNAKDRLEHALVVDALRDALAEIASEITGVGAPQLLTVRNTHHLYTPLRARLRERRSVFDLIARLHPTPAVGGVPRDAALAWIRRREGWDRGWYAGPIGWVNAAGEGEAAVAIRSALLEPAQARLFAGCGIVADSDPEQEFAESNWKLRPLLSALSGPVSPDAPAAASPGV